MDDAKLVLPGYRLIVSTIVPFHFMIQISPPGRLKHALNTDGLIVRLSAETVYFS